MPGEEFITIREAQPQRPPYNPAVNRPAVPATAPSYQGQVGQQPPRAVNVSGQQYHSQSPIGQQYYPRPAPASTPQWRQRQYTTTQPGAKVEISDLRKKRPLTDEEARQKKREAYSQYSVVRIVRDEGSRASDGTKRKRSWARVQLIPDLSITKKEAARAVRKLDQTTPSVTEKKRELTEDQRRQIELAFSLQQEGDDETFQTALVQLEDEVEEEPKKSEREGGKERERRKNRHRTGDAGRSGAASKSHSRSQQPKNVAPDRVSITAYFKRTLRPEIDPFSIPQSLNAQHNVHIADIQQAYSPVATQPVNAHYPPPPRQHVPPPQQNIPPPHQHIPPPQHNIPQPQSNSPPAQPPPRSTDNGAPNPARNAQAYAHSPRTAPAQPTPRRSPNPAARRASPHQRSPYHRRPSPSIRDGARSPLSTDESASSKVFSDADDDTDYTDPSTPSYISNRDFFDRPRKSSRYRESPAHYGIQSKFGRGKPRGEVHIQPHRSHERRPDLGARQQTVPVLNQQALPQRMSDPAPGQGFPQPRPANANMASAVPPTAPSQPPSAQVPTEPPRPAGPAQFPVPPPGAQFPVPPPGAQFQAPPPGAQFPAPPPGAQSQGRPPGHVPAGHNPAAFPSQPNPTSLPGQQNPEPVSGQQWQVFSGGAGSHPPRNMAPRGPGPMNGMNGIDPRNQANPMNPNPPVNPAVSSVNGSNPAMSQRAPGNPGNPGNPGSSEGNPSQNLSQNTPQSPLRNPDLNPTVLYAKAYAKGRQDIHEEALHMAERVAERVVAAAVPLKAEGRRRGASPVVIQQDRRRGRSGRDRDRGRDRDCDDYDDSEIEQPRSRFVSQSRSHSRSLDRGRHDQDRRREKGSSLERRRDREGERGRKHDQRHRRYHDHGRERSRSLDKERRRDRARSRTRSLDRQRGRTRSRSRSLDRQRGGRGRTRSRSLHQGGTRQRGGRSRTRSRSRSLDRQRGGRDRTRSRSLGRGGARHRYRSGDRHHHNERDWDGDQQKRRRRERGKEGYRSRSRSRSLNRVRPLSPKPYRGPHSGFRIVRPSSWYAATRNGMDRKGPGRDVDLPWLDERDGLDPQDDVFYGRGRNEPVYGAPTRAWAKGANRDGDREREIRAEVLRREEERSKRDEEERVRDDFIRRRDLGIDVGPPFGDSNPFVPQPRSGRRTGAGTGMHVRLEDYEL